MLQLFTLGELRLVADDGTLLSRRGKLLLLLTYLARRAPHAVPRPELAALLWGERDESRARHSLRQSLVELHRLVGERLVVAPDTVRLDATGLELDAERFERDVDAGEDRAAIARWRGDFLSGADDRAEGALQRWLETERAGLRRRRTLAFERLLDEAERLGTTRDALAIARRWTELAPLDERACERLVATLRRTGHAADALAAHAQFTAHVREAAAAEPSREFLRLAEALDEDARGARAAPPATSRPPTAALPFVGRAAVLAMLADAWRHATTGTPAVVVLTASHGMGATRLGEALMVAARQHAVDAVVLRANARDAASDPARAYATARAMLHDLAPVDALGGLAPEVLAALAQLVPPLRERFPRLPPAPEVDPAGLAAAVCEAVDAAAEDAPVLVAVDTLPDADAESRAVLLALAEGVRGAVLVVLVVRPDDAGQATLDRLRGRTPGLRVATLGPLSADDVAGMLDVAGGPGEAGPTAADACARLAHAVHRDTAGVPRYAAAAIEALRDDGVLTPSGGAGGALAGLGGRGLPVPARVRSDVLQRLRALDPVARQVAEVAAVRAAPCLAADLVRLTGLTPTDVDRALAALERAGFLGGAGEPGPGLALQPPVVARAVAALIPPLRREALYAATGRGGRRARRWGAALAALLLVLAAVGGARVWSTFRPAPARGRTVAVFPFSVSGGSDVAYLRAGMADLLSTSLDGVGGFHTLDPRVVIAAARPESAAVALAPEQAGRIAARLGVTYYVLGTVVGAGRQLEVGATLYDARRAGAPVARASAAGGDAALFRLVDRVTAQLAVAQGGQGGERLARLAAVTTTSLDALKAYLEGRDAYRANDLFAALPAFQRAVAADSSFALAWYGLATTASWMLSPGLERQAAARAVREDGRLSARDRMLVEAFAAYSRGSADSAERMATSVVETYDDIEGWVLLGEVLYHHNWKRGRSVAESRRAWERVLALDPAYWPALQHLAEVAALEGRGAEADSLLGRYERSVGTSHMMLASRALRAYAYGDAAARGSLERALAADRGFFLTASVWYVAVVGRDVADARTLAGVLVQPLRPPEQQGFGHVLLAHLDLAQGRWREARAELAIARVLTPDDALEHHLLLGMAPFLATPAPELARLRAELRRLPTASGMPSTMPWPRTHDALHPLLHAYLAGMSGARVDDDAGRAAARAALANLERLPDPTGPVALAKGFALSIHAEQARQQQRPAEALAALERGARQTPFVPAWTSGFVSQAYERYARAELLHALGRDDEALRWYGTLGENSPYDLVYLAPSVYRQAQIAETRGQRALAAARYARFVALWKDCDPELRPLTADATARIARLQ